MVSLFLAYMTESDVEIVDLLTCCNDLLHADYINTAECDREGYTLPYLKSQMILIHLTCSH